MPPACSHVLGAPGSSTKPAVRRPLHHPDFKPLIRMEVNCQPMLRAGTRTAPAAGQGKLKVDEPQSSRLCSCSVGSEQVLQPPSHARAARQLPLRYRPHELLAARSEPAPTLVPGAGDRSRVLGPLRCRSISAQRSWGQGTESPWGVLQLLQALSHLGNLTGNISAGRVQRVFGEVSGKPH